MERDPNRPATIVELESRFDTLNARQTLVEQRVRDAERAHHDGQKEIMDSLQRLTRIEQVPAALAGHARQIGVRIDKLEAGINGRFDGIEERLDGHETRLDALEDEAKLREGRGQIWQTLGNAARWFATNWLQLLIGAGVLILFAKQAVPTPIREHIEQMPQAAASVPDWPLVLRE